MKIIFLANNDISGNLLNWLKDEAKEQVLQMNDKVSKEIIEHYKPDILISYNYKYLIMKEVLDILPNRIINLHVSVLPWNRGAHPNLWSFLEDSPKGVTIHIINEGIDTGDILLQKEIYIDEEKETLFSSYKILHTEIQELFILNWDKIKTFKISPKPQMNGGSVHYKEDFDKIKHILGDEGWNIRIPELKKRFKNMSCGAR